MMRPPALLFGVPIADLTMDETVAAIGDLVVQGRATGRTHQVATVNVDFLVNAMHDPAVRSILQHAGLSIADGMPIVWGARLLGMRLRERVAGADLVPRLVDESQRTGWHVHVFGSSPQVAAVSTQLLRDRYPAASFSIDPGPVISDVTSVDQGVIESIRAVDADILCIALGNPKQERFIAAHGSTIGSPVIMGVGGTLDLLAGKRRRAPRWMQSVGLEWAVRAVQEPRRLGTRYTRDIQVYCPRLMQEWRDARFRQDAGGIEVRLRTTSVEVDLGISGVPDANTWSLAASRLCDGAELVIGLHHATTTQRLRRDAAARLIGLVAIARRNGPGTLRWHDEASKQHCAMAMRELGVPLDLLGLDDVWECPRP